jgi:hypothetical protein
MARKIIAIEMASDKDIYEVRLGAELSFKKDKDGDYSIFEGNEEMDCGLNLNEAHDWVNDEDVIADPMLVVSGYGKHSGRKFWQLPNAIKRECLRMARK